MNIVKIAKSAVSQVKIDQEGLDLLRVNVRKDAKKSRAVLRLTSEIGIDLPGDQLENLLVLAVNTLWEHPHLHAAKRRVTVSFAA